MQIKQTILSFFMLCCYFLIYCHKIKHLHPKIKFHFPEYELIFTFFKYFSRNWWLVTSSNETTNRNSLSPFLFQVESSISENSVSDDEFCDESCDESLQKQFVNTFPLSVCPETLEEIVRHIEETEERYFIVKIIIGL